MTSGDPHQCELIAMQLSGPEGFRTVAVHQRLLAVDLILRLPGRKALQVEKATVKIEKDSDSSISRTSTGNNKREIFLRCFFLLNVTAQPI